MIDWIADFLAARGVASRRFYDPSGGKANLYARLGPSGGGGVMLSGHTDVVPVDGRALERSAFQPHRARWPLLWPRQRDMKGFLACVLAAVDDFLAAPLRMPLHLAFSYDEEVGCLGVRSLVDFLQASPEKPALCLIGEPTEMQPVFGHKGKLAMRCCIEGQACHSAYAPQGGERHPLRGETDQPRIGWACVWPGSRTAAFRRPSARCRWAPFRVGPR